MVRKPQDPDYVYLELNPKRFASLNIQRKTTAELTLMSKSFMALLSLLLITVRAIYLFDFLICSVSVQIVQLFFKRVVFNLPRIDTTSPNPTTTRMPYLLMTTIESSDRSSIMKISDQHRSNRCSQ